MTKETRSRVISGALSRRDVVRAGGLLLPASALIPGLFTRVAEAATGFDYYISKSGSDSNPGTLASPWALTAINTKQSLYAGKRLGIIAGTYDISAMMNPANHTPVLNINGGPNSSTPTYLAASDTSGNYAPRTVTITANGNGSFGGGNSNISSMMGQGAGPNLGTNWGNWTIDGLRFTGYSVWAVHIGSYDGTGGLVPNATIQNCEFTGGNAQSSTVANGVNLASIVIYTGTNCAVKNCYLHDNVGWTDPVHFNAVYVWGFGGLTTGTLFQNCTLINTGSIYGKSDAGLTNPQAGVTVTQCYIDMTKKTPSGGSLIAGVGGFCNAGTTGRPPSYFHHNIVVGGNGMDLQCQTTAGATQWYNNMYCYNNTFVLGAGQIGGGNVGFRMWEQSGLSRLFYFYNNLIYDNGFTLDPYGYVSSNANGFSVLDYNVYGTLDAFTTYPSGVGSGSGTSTSLAGWKAATGGDAHSLSNGTNPFTNNGALALQYQVQAGSAAYQAGRVGGVSTGSVCNVGAWDGSVANIGCNFAGGGSGSAAVPDAPVLSVS